MPILEKEYPTIISRKDSIISDIITSIDSLNRKMLLNSQGLRLILDEAISNAMEHGNKFHADKKIRVKINRRDDHIEITISDEGDGFCINEKRIELHAEKLNERGMGLNLIRNLCPAEWFDNGATITLQIPVESPL